MRDAARVPWVIDHGVATLTLPGQTESGDRHVVAAGGHGVLVAVVDGLGHGAEAAGAARDAVRVLERHAGESPRALLERCHEALQGTRGVVLSLACFDGPGHSMTWLGVGNVEGVLLRGGSPARATLVTRGGIVGWQLPPLRPQVVAVAPGDTLLFATDGIRSGFAQRLPADASPQQLADHVLAHHATGNDDALVLVARYLGGGAVG